MNREELKRRNAIEQAWIDHKPVQFRKYLSPNWKDITDDDLVWDWCIFEYRIKPKPEEFKIWWHPDHGYYHPIKITIHPSWAGEGWTQKTFREVIEE